MERSRRQRLSEIYGASLSQAHSPNALRQRLSKQQLDNSINIKKDLDPVQKTPLKLETKINKMPLNKVVLSSSPLIPTTVLDVGSQRAFAVVLFSIIQSYKLYDLILLKNNIPFSSLLGFPSPQFNFITKYLFYDSAFLYFLPAFRIPALSFSKTIVILQIILFILINLFLASDLSFPLTTILFTAWKRLNSKDLTILGGSVNTEKYEPSKHFKGSHTIKILPENTAYLNPFHESFCLPIGASNYIQNVPIRFNSTSEIEFLQIKYTDFDTNSPTLLNYTKKEIKKFDTRNVNNLYEKDHISGPNIHYLNFPVTKSGLYEINQVLDSKYLGLRNYRSTLVVPHCPTAQINDVTKLSKNKCIGDVDSIKFTIEGVPPLKLKYKKLINHSVQEFNDQSLQPEYFQSPLIAQGNSKYFSKEQLEDLSWAKIQPVEVELENPINQLGDYSYRIEAITDGLGNIVNFTDIFLNNEESFTKYDLIHTFKVHDSPKVQLSEKVNKNSATKRSLILTVDQGYNEASPFEAQIKHTSEDESEVKVFSYTFNNPHDEFKVEKPGIYTLLSVKSKYCGSIISGHSSVSVSLPVVPQININSKPITDSCVGQVGLVFDFSFIGTPPFTLEQKVYRVTGEHRHLHETKTLISQGTRYRFSYEPSSEGNYEISFTSLIDSLYQDPIQLAPVQDYTFKTSMRVKPNAEVSGYHSNKALCLGSTAKIPIQFKGEAPFALDYDIIETSTNKRTPYSIKDIRNNRYEIITPEFRFGGEYIVSLTAVEDKSGCLVNLNGADAKIKIRREVPSVSFSNTESSTVKIKEGDSAELPIRILGEGSFNVAYELLDENKNVVSTHEKSFRNSYKASINVNKAGHYRLKSIRDSDCQGIVEGSDLVEIIYHPKPKLSVSTNTKSNVKVLNNNVFEKKQVCQFHEDTIDLSLQGSPPFVVDYVVVSPDGRRSSKSMSVATKFSSIRLLNDKGGEHKYIITGVYDSLYSKYDLEKIHDSFDQIVVKQKVNPSPKGEFKDKRKSYRTCTTNLLEKDLLDPIKLSLDGSAPYSITFEIYHESSSKSEYLTLQNIDSQSSLYELYRGLKLGNHIVTIVKIVDNDGCIKEDFAENNYISISISDTAKINQLDPSVNYCVGDHVGYQLTGTPPFTIVYAFNDLNLKTIESSSQFIRLASDAGTISIKSIQDSSSSCVNNFTLPENKDQASKLDILVHQIPSVEVSQGDSIIQDIHEGDQAEIIFTFQGSPPFALTYVRTEETETRRGRKKSQVVETHTINDIYAYEYRVLTSLQGTYEAIEVSDAFCVARNE